MEDKEWEEYEIRAEALRAAAKIFEGKGLSMNMSNNKTIEVAKVFEEYLKNG